MNLAGLGLGRARSPTMYFQKFSETKKLWNTCSNKKNGFEQQFLQFVLKLLLLVETIVSCWKSAHARGAVREPREAIIDPWFYLGGHLFLHVFSHPFFSYKIEIFNENGRRNGLQSGLLLAVFSGKEGKSQSVFRLHRRVRIAFEPTPWSAQGDPKLPKKTDWFQKPFFSKKNQKIHKKWHPKGLQMGDFISR